MTHGIQQWLAEMNLEMKVIGTAAAVILVYLCMFIAFRIVSRKIEDVNRRHRARRAALYIATGVVLVLLALIWIGQLSEGNLPVLISVTAAGLVIALGDTILSVAGWLFILVRRPYSVGDRIKIGDVIGDVIDIKLFQTTMLEVGGWVSGEQSTFRLVHCPNNALFRQPVWNYTSGFPFIWDELGVVVTFESDWRKARQIMLDHVTEGGRKVQQLAESGLIELAKKYAIKYSTLTPTVYVTIADNGVKLTLRYLTDARGRRTTQDELSRGILQDFEEHEDIKFAYPTYRIVTEQKRGAGPPDH
jgi:small-conductance mechanosensitive channel